MKSIKQLRETYDLITEKEDTDFRKLTTLVRAGLFDAKKLPLLKRALEKDAGKLTPAERKVLIQLLDSLMSEVLGSQQLYTKVKQNVMTKEEYIEEARTDYYTRFDPRFKKNPKTLPNIIILKRKAMRVYPDNQVVGLYYSQTLDKYISIPFDTGSKGSKHINAVMNEQKKNDDDDEKERSVDWRERRQQRYDDKLRNTPLSQLQYGKTEKAANQRIKRVRRIAATDAVNRLSAGDGRGARVAAGYALGSLLTRGKQIPKKEPVSPQNTSVATNANSSVNSNTNTRPNVIVSKFKPNTQIQATSINRSRYKGPNQVSEMFRQKLSDKRNKIDEAGQLFGLAAGGAARAWGGIKAAGSKVRDFFKRPVVAGSVGAGAGYAAGAAGSDKGGKDEPKYSSTDINPQKAKTSSSGKFDPREQEYNVKNKAATRKILSQTNESSTEALGRGIGRGFFGTDRVDPEDARRRAEAGADNKFTRQRTRGRNPEKPETIKQRATAAGDEAAERANRENQRTSELEKSNPIATKVGEIGGFGASILGAGGAARAGGRAVSTAAATQAARQATPTAASLKDAINRGRGAAKRRAEKNTKPTKPSSAVPGTAVGAAQLAAVGAGAGYAAGAAGSNKGGKDEPKYSSTDIDPQKVKTSNSLRKFDPRQQEFDVLNKATTRKLSQANEHNISLLKKNMINETTSLVLNDGSQVNINRNIAEKIVNLYESLNVKNKKVMLNLLNENHESFKKVLNFTVRQ